MVIRRVRPISVGKMFGAVYCALGLIFGFFLLLASMFGAGLSGMSGEMEAAGPVIALLFGGGAIVLLPLFYGLMGFIGGIISALIYNLAAGAIGGIEIDVA